jgi:hypothetical protein
MALRVARGLFRLWLVLSVLWIAGVGIMTWQTFPSGPKWVPVEAPPWAEPAERQEFNPDKYLTSKLIEERHSAIWHASLLALPPPTFVLALGLALAWAFRGFR